jgi:flagellar biosynthesis protein FlhA
MLLLSAVFLGSGLPWFQLLVVGGFFAVAAAVKGASDKTRAKAEAEKREREAVAGRKPEKVEGLLKVDPMELEVGLGLVKLVDPEQGGGFLDRVAQVRRQMAVDLGLVVPPVRIRDNESLEPNSYAIKIRGVALATGSLRPDRWLAMDAGSATGTLEGIATREPAFGLNAYWIPEELKSTAEVLGYRVADPGTVLSTHLTETIKKYAHELLTRDEVNHLIKALKEESPAVVEEVVPTILKPGEVQKVLQNLLREGVSIRDLGTILETLGDYGPRIKDPEVLTEYVRNSLARSISRSHLSADGRLRVVTLDPRLEDVIKAATERGERGSVLALSPALVTRIGQRLSQELAKLVAGGHEPVVLCSPQVRAQVKKLAETVQPGVTVLSYNEIVQDVRVESLGMVAAE